MNNQIYQAMHKIGMFEEVNQLGAQYDRVKHFLQAINNPEKTYKNPLQRPNLPIFEGLENCQFSNNEDIPAAIQLQRHADTICKEVKALDLSNYLFYSPQSSTTAVNKQWGILPLYYMGLALQEYTQLCPKTFDLICNLPNICNKYAWGDALLSWQGPHSTLASHCSVDNLRTRIHLAIDIPDDTGIRVGNITKHWKERECLVFDDSFEHEVWNRSDKGRLVLIVDTWNPNLTENEKLLLTYIFNKWEIKQTFYHHRLSHAGMQAEQIANIGKRLTKLSSKQFIGPSKY